MKLLRDISRLDGCCWDICRTALEFEIYWYVDAADIFGLSLELVVPLFRRSLYLF